MTDETKEPGLSLPSTRRQTDALALALFDVMRHRSEVDRRHVLEALRFGSSGPDAAVRVRAVEALRLAQAELGGFPSYRRYEESTKRRVFAFLWAALIPTGTWTALAESFAQGGVGRHTMPEPAGDYYTFAGEIPWSPTFAASLQLDNLPDATVETRTLEEGTELTLTGTAHEHNWESYHSVTNRADNGIVPSRAICDRLELRGLPQTFDLVERDGSLASRCYSAPIGFGGRLLYLREDLLDRYMRETGTELAWLAWGERELQFDDRNNIPQWYLDLRRKDKDQHRRVVSLAQLKSKGT